jgi:hypothetical protein
MLPYLAVTRATDIDLFALEFFAAPQPGLRSARSARSVRLTWGLVLVRRPGDADTLMVDSMQFRQWPDFKLASVVGRR